ncbi:MAG: hypothetical protein NTV70_09840 [Acidobacteria bacterium]|nr:hypothetical protein [Acidobacteriota bacterium]
MADAIAQLLEIGYQARRENRPADAVSAFWAAAAQARSAANPEGTRMLARALTGLGQMARDEGQLSGALGHYQEAAALFRSLDDPARLAHTVRHVGDIHIELAQPGLAGHCYGEALTLYRGLPQTSPGELANALRSWALFQEARGAREEASGIWREVQALYQAAGIAAGVTESTRRLTALANETTT